ANLCAAELRTAEQVRSLPAGQAEQSIPVRLKGVVTFFDRDLFSQFIQDGTAGIYLQDVPSTPMLSPGQIVEVDGMTGAGEYAPVIVPQKVVIIGEGTLPQARLVSFERLASGKEDSQFVEVSGIVRTVDAEEASGRHVLEIATGGGHLKVFSKDLPVQAAESLVDSIIRLRGV